MAVIATTRTGRVRGREKDGVLLFAGIPYEAAPVGGRRFRAPTPHFDATSATVEDPDGEERTAREGLR